MSVSERLLKWLPSAILKRIDAFPLGRRLARGAFWTLAGAFAARVLRIPVSIFLARHMGPTTYGELGMVGGSIDLFGALAGLGLGLTATKYIGELRVRDPARAGRIVALSTVIATAAGGVCAAVLYLLAPWLAAHVLAAPRLTGPLRIGAIALCFASMNGAQLGALYGFEAFRVTARLSAIIGVLEVPLLVGGGLFGGLDGVLWGMTGSRFADWVLKRHALKAEAERHGINIKFGHWREELSVFWHFSIPAALSGVMVIPVSWICSALLVNRPHGYEEMGAYNAASQWYASLMLIPSVLGSGLLPILSDRIGALDGKSSESILGVMMKINAIILIPSALGMSVFSPLIMRIYGVEYGNAWPTLIAVVWTAAVLGIVAPVGDVIAATGRMWLGLSLNSGWAVVYIVSTVLLVSYGSLGLASSRLIAYALHAGWTLAFAYRAISKYQSRSMAGVDPL